MEIWELSEKLINILETYSDTLEQASIDEAYLDCTNKIASSDTTIEQYAVIMKKAIKQQCVRLHFSTFNIIIHLKL